MPFPHFLTLLFSFTGEPWSFYIFFLLPISLGSLSFLLLTPNLYCPLFHSPFNFLLPSSYVCKISISIFCNAGLAVMNSFSLCFSWDIFIPFKILKDNFAGYSNIGQRLLSFRTWKHISMASWPLEFLQRNLWTSWVYLFKCFCTSLIAFKILSKFWTFGILSTMHCRKLLLWSCLIGVLNS